MISPRYDIKEIVEEALDKGLLDKFSDKDYHVPLMLRGIMLLRQGVLLPGAADLHSVSKWRYQEIELVKNLVHEDILLNACAEEYHHAFGNKDLAFNGFLWGVLLGQRLVKVYGYYSDAMDFWTWVVGVDYEERWKNLKGLKRGDRVILLREPENEYDPNAIKVLTETGKELGFLRRTLANILAPQVDNGQIQLSGSIASAFSIKEKNWWLYIRISKKVCVETFGPLYCIEKEIASF